MPLYINISLVQGLDLRLPSAHTQFTVTKSTGRLVLYWITGCLYCIVNTCSFLRVQWVGSMHEMVEYNVGLAYILLFSMLDCSIRVYQPCKLRTGYNKYIEGPSRPFLSSTTIRPSLCTIIVQVWVYLFWLFFPALPKELPNLFTG